MKLTMIYLIASIMMLSGGFGRHHKTNQIKYLGINNNFLSLKAAADGHHEKRIVYDGIAAKETYVTEKGHNRELALWQVTDGIHFIQSIYYGKELQDCEYVSNPEDILKFLKEFQEDEQKLQFLKLNPEVTMDVTNVSRRLLENEDAPEDMQRMLHMHLLKRECDERHEKIKSEHHMEDISDMDMDEEFFVGNQVSRRKRSMSIFPGTKWCGHGNLPPGSDPLGGRTHADRCCRRHDMCPYNIRRFESKYGIRNMGLTTISHCSCDFRFRGCLRSIEGKVGDMIGMIFFNVVKFKCFTLETKRLCVEKDPKSNKCLKSEWRKLATLKKQAPY